MLLKQAIDAADASTRAVDRLTQEVHGLRTEVAVLSTRLAAVETTLTKTGERGWQVFLAAAPGVVGLAWLALQAAK